MFLKRTVSAQLHLLGFILASTGLAFLLYLLWNREETVHFWVCLIFGTTSLIVFAASTIYHFLSDGFLISEKLDQFMEDLDHSAIYMFIAGSYTPFIVNVFHDPWQEILMTLIWLIAVLGIGYTLFKRRLPTWARHRFVSTALFVMMGWTLLIRINEAMEVLKAMEIFLLVAGGVAYTVGALVYATKWPNPIKNVFGFHEVWHVFVMLGYAFHYLLILRFYIHLW